MAPTFDVWESMRQRTQLAASTHGDSGCLLVSGAERGRVPTTAQPSAHDSYLSDKSALSGSWVTLACGGGEAFPATTVAKPAGCDTSFAVPPNSVSATVSTQGDWTAPYQNLSPAVVVSQSQTNALSAGSNYLQRSNHAGLFPDNQSGPIAPTSGQRRAATGYLTSAGSGCSTTGTNRLAPVESASLTGVWGPGFGSVAHTAIATANHEHTLTRGPAEGPCGTSVPQSWSRGVSYAAGTVQQPHMNPINKQQEHLRLSTANGTYALQQQQQQAHLSARQQQSAQQAQIVTAGIWQDREQQQQEPHAQQGSFPGTQRQQQQAADDAITPLSTPSAQWLVGQTDGGLNARSGMMNTPADVHERQSGTQGSLALRAHVQPMSNTTGLGIQHQQSCQQQQGQSGFSMGAQQGGGVAEHCPHSSMLLSLSARSEQRVVANGQGQTAAHTMLPPPPPQQHQQQQSEVESVAGSGGGLSAYQQSLFMRPHTQQQPVLPPHLGFHSHAGSHVQLQPHEPQGLSMRPSPAVMQVLQGSGPLATQPQPDRQGTCGGLHMQRRPQGAGALQTAQQGHQAILYKQQLLQQQEEEEEEQRLHELLLLDTAPVPEWAKGLPTTVQRVQPPAPAMQQHQFQATSGGWPPHQGEFDHQPKPSMSGTQRLQEQCQPAPQPHLQTSAQQQLPMSQQQQPQQTAQEGSWSNASGMTHQAQHRPPQQKQAVQQQQHVSSSLEPAKSILYIVGQGGEGAPQQEGLMGMVAAPKRQQPEEQGVAGAGASSLRQPSSCQWPNGAASQSQQSFPPAAPASASSGASVTALSCGSSLFHMEHLKQGQQQSCRQQSWGPTTAPAHSQPQPQRRLTDNGNVMQSGRGGQNQPMPSELQSCFRQQFQQPQQHHHHHHLQQDLSCQHQAPPNLDSVQQQQHQLSGQDSCTTPDGTGQEEVEDVAARSGNWNSIPRSQAVPMSASHINNPARTGSSALLRHDGGASSLQQQHQVSQPVPQQPQQPSFPHSCPSQQQRQHSEWTMSTQEPPQPLAPPPQQQQHCHHHYLMHEPAQHLRQHEATRDAVVGPDRGVVPNGVAMRGTASNFGRPHHPKYTEMLLLQKQQEQLHLIQNPEQAPQQSSLVARTPTQLNGMLQSRTLLPLFKSAQDSELRCVSPPHPTLLQQHNLEQQRQQLSMAGPGSGRSSQDGGEAFQQVMGVMSVNASAAALASAATTHASNSISAHLGPRTQQIGQASQYEQQQLMLRMMMMRPSVMPASPAALPAHDKSLVKGHCTTGLIMTSMEQHLQQRQQLLLQKQQQPQTSLQAVASGQPAVVPMNWPSLLGGPGGSTQDSSAAGLSRQLLLQQYSEVLRVSQQGDLSGPLGTQPSPQQQLQQHTSRLSLPPPPSLSPQQQEQRLLALNSGQDLMATRPPFSSYSPHMPVDQPQLQSSNQSTILQQWQQKRLEERQLTMMNEQMQQQQFQLQQPQLQPGYQQQMQNQVQKPHMQQQSLQQQQLYLQHQAQQRQLLQQQMQQQQLLQQQMQGESLQQQIQSASPAYFLDQTSALHDHRYWTSRPETAFAQATMPATFPSSMGPPSAQDSTVAAVGAVQWSGGGGPVGCHGSSSGSSSAVAVEPPPKRFKLEGEARPLLSTAVAAIWHDAREEPTPVSDACDTAAAAAALVVNDQRRSSYCWAPALVLNPAPGYESSSEVNPESILRKAATHRASCYELPLPQQQPVCPQALLKQQPEEQRHRHQQLKLVRRRTLGASKVKRGFGAAEAGIPSSPEPTLSAARGPSASCSPVELESSPWSAEIFQDMLPEFADALVPPSSLQHRRPQSKPGKATEVALPQPPPPPPPPSHDSSARSRPIDLSKLGQHRLKPQPVIHPLRPGSRLALAASGLCGGAIVPPSCAALVAGGTAAVSDDTLCGSGVPSGLSSAVVTFTGTITLGTSAGTGGSVAGGSGRRLAVKDRKVPAAMLPVVGKTMGVGAGGVRIKRCGTSGRGGGDSQAAGTGTLLNALREANALLSRRFVVRRSSIAQQGVFAAEHIPADTLLMEYHGEAVRATVSDLREKRYTAAGLGCYLFHPGGLPDEAVVLDATHRGNIMRFVNHSCGPNCYSRTFVIEGQRRIFLFSFTELQPGTELTYDYKLSSVLCMDAFKGLPEHVFEQAAAQAGVDLLVCHCGHERCRKYL